MTDESRGGGGQCARPPSTLVPTFFAYDLLLHLTRLHAAERRDRRLPLVVGMSTSMYDESKCLAAYVNGFVI